MPAQRRTTMRQLYTRAEFLRVLAAAQSRRRLLWAAAIGGALLLIGIVTLVRREPAAPLPVAVPAITPLGAVTSPPFGSVAETAVAAAPTAAASLAQLKAEYFALHDRAARFALLKHRAEPEAQYLAYRAFHECGRVMTSFKDVNDLGFEIRRLWAEGGATERARREAALEQWAGACRGFLRPNPDVSREARTLLERSAAAGHVGARALDFDFTAESDPQATHELAEAIAASGDPLTLLDGHMVVLKARMGCGDAEAQASERQTAWILAACRLGDCYNSDLYFKHAMCALEGACDRQSIEPIYLNPRRHPVDQRRLLDRVGVVEAQMRAGRADLALACGS